jgi:quinol monooxygenase YgiN
MSQPGKPAAFVVIAEFVVKPDCIDAFLALARDDASHSVADEPGCRQFDVVQMEGRLTMSSSTRCMTAGRRLMPICKRHI